MKILAFTDTHNSKAAHRSIKEKAEKNNPDLLICCGDLSIFSRGLDGSARFINSLKKICLIIPGNHETPKEIKEICSKYKNLKYMHAVACTIGDYIFFGYGTGGFALRNERFEKIYNKFLKIKLKSKKLIFITHAPIYKTKLDEIYYEHKGCLSSRKFIEKTKPILTLCGHFHENEGKKDKIKDSLILNPGRFGKIINI